MLIHSDKNYIPTKFTNELEIESFDVQVIDLIESNLCRAGDEIFLTYKPRGGQRAEFVGIIQPNGTVLVQDREFPSLSYAALFCIQQAGGSRPSVNGWTSWKNSQGRFLAEIREEFLQTRAVGGTS